MKSILVVDDERSVRMALQAWLEEWFEVDTAQSAEEGLLKLDQNHYDVMVLDERMPGMKGSEMLRVMQKRHPEQAVIMMTAHGSVDQAVEAMRVGASDYLLKPVNPDALKMHIDRVLGMRALEEENRRLREQVAKDFSFHNIISRDPTIRVMCKRIEAVARSNAAVLIQGESGTGKELVARALHQASDRSHEPFVTVSCGAIPDTLLEAELFGHKKGSFTGAIRDREGKFKEVGAGTIFLDEIGELSPAAQVKFLRVLQEKTFQEVGGTATHAMEARIVSATNRNLEEAIEEGSFRSDLYYRINTVRVDLPALRNRKGDVVLLAQHFADQLAEQYGKKGLAGLSPEVMAVLQRHGWPGNVRELRGVMEHAVILAGGKHVEVGDLPDYLVGGERTRPDGNTFHEMMDNVGREIILAAIDEADGLKKDAASSLGLSQRALSHYLKKYGIIS